MNNTQKVITFITQLNTEKKNRTTLFKCLVINNNLLSPPKDNPVVNLVSWWKSCPESIIQPRKAQPREIESLKKKKKKETPLLSVAIIKTVDVLDNVIAAVTNDLRSRLKVRVCTVSTFYSEPQHLSSARRFLH